jgi:uncharacterized Tic20 family protein
MSEAASQDDRTMAMISHLSGIVAGFIGPLVVWLINKDKTDKAWLNDQAKEALNFQITMIIGWLIAGVLTMVLIGMLLVPVLFLANIILCIMAGMKANEGVSYRYPLRAPPDQVIRGRRAGQLARATANPARTRKASEASPIGDSAVSHLRSQGRELPARSLHAEQARIGVLALRLVLAGGLAELRRRRLRCRGRSSRIWKARPRARA